jgi:predicted DNA-binding helix-hairpin-helix protein
MHLFYGNYVDGLFLSSGIAGDPDRTMSDMIQSVKLIRKEFNGYIHLKIIPGASYDLVKRACELADRVSINLEAPGKRRLAYLSEEKQFKTDILRRAAWVKNLIRKGLAQSGHTTQFVVGPADESDLELVKMSRWMYERLDLKRAYFSAFQPVENTPLSSTSRTPLIREHRLYQMDWLLRIYNFDLKSMMCVFHENGRLPIEHDPKFVYATQKEVFIKPSDATYSELLTVPGIGPTSARRLETMQKFGNIGIKQLKNAGVVLKRALPFLDLGGRQMRLSSYAR